MDSIYKCNRGFYNNGWLIRFNFRAQKRDNKFTQRRKNTY